MRMIGRRRPDFVPCQAFQEQCIKRLIRNFCNTCEWRPRPYNDDDVVYDTIMDAMDWSLPLRDNIRMFHHYIDQLITKGDKEDTYEDPNDDYGKEESEEAKEARRTFLRLGGFDEDIDWEV